MESDVIERRQCSAADCHAGEDQRCLEGFVQLSECPKWAAGRSIALATPTPAFPGGIYSNENAIEADVQETSSRVKLFSGEALSSSQANEIAARARSRLVVVAGEPNSGKTTLLSTVYDLFQLGPQEGLRFAGSRTLMGFEKRCFLSRLAADREQPDTPHTAVLEEAEFLHLMLGSEHNSAPADLLFTDIAGEMFVRLRDSASESPFLELVRRADFFVLVLDGARLAEKKERQAALASAKHLLRTLAEKRILDRATLVVLAATKNDILECIAEKDRLFIGRELDSIVKFFNDLSIPCVALYTTCRRTGDVPWGTGVGKLVARFMSPLKGRSEHVAASLPLRRMFDFYRS